jgi:hypothetical protein
MRAFTHQRLAHPAEEDAAVLAKSRAWHEKGILFPPNFHGGGGRRIRSARAMEQRLRGRRIRGGAGDRAAAARATEHAAQLT